MLRASNVEVVYDDVVLALRGVSLDVSVGPLRQQRRARACALPPAAGEASPALSRGRHGGCPVGGKTQYQGHSDHARATWRWCWARAPRRHHESEDRAPEPTSISHGDARDAADLRRSDSSS